jgi:hypothetical protein
MEKQLPKIAEANLFDISEVIAKKRCKSFYRRR